VSGNRAIGEGVDSGFGGGIWVSAWGGPASVTLVNSTVSDNRAASGGGGLAALGLSCTCDAPADPIGWCEALLPSSPVGPSVIFQNTIVSSNQAPVGAACLSCESILISQGHNLEDRDDCGFHEMGDLTNTDPSLGPLGDNGGLTWTHLPLAGSPVIDAGRCPDFPTDQRSYWRPIDHRNATNAADGCDIGAVELQVD
jgi:hypothetical protein